MKKLDVNTRVKMINVSHEIKQCEPSLHNPLEDTEFECTGTVVGSFKIGFYFFYMIKWDNGMRSITKHTRLKDIGILNENYKSVW